MLAVFLASSAWPTGREVDASTSASLTSLAAADAEFDEKADTSLGQVDSCHFFDSVFVEVLRCAFLARLCCSTWIGAGTTQSKERSRLARLFEKIYSYRITAP